MKLLIFNPEHDLCLANGSCDYVPPKSAVDFARSRASLMQCLYTDAHCCSTYDVFPTEGVTEVIAWGWNTVVKKHLLRGGISAALLPSDTMLESWRHLQHRNTLLPLQPEVLVVKCEEDVERLLESGNRRWVLKAPWSGAGRGLHWIDGAVGNNERAWLRKTVETQGCVMAEPWHNVVVDFAFEYIAQKGGLTFVGYSMFTTVRGVYRSNVQLDDGHIQDILEQKSSPKALREMRNVVEKWLLTNVVTHYFGPIGIDLVIDDKNRIHVCEMNLRHTMGMVAHAKMSGNPLR